MLCVLFVVYCLLTKMSVDLRVLTFQISSRGAFWTD